MSTIPELLENHSLDVSNASQLRLALEHLNKKLGVCHNELEVIQTNSDQFFLTVNAVFILMMQAGFGFFEAGCVRSKNVVNMLFKNVMDAFFGGVAYWVVGYAFAFGEPCNGFIGMNHFFGLNLSSTLYSHWFFHYSFCVTAATIVSGAVAERCDFFGYVCYSLVITGITYPVVTHWAWHSGDSCVGWLAWLGYQDFAGSGVVHVCGGTGALIGAVVLGPRIGRFPQFEGDVVHPIQPHNLPFASLGAFLLFVGFFAFNGGSQASISAKLDGEQTGRAMMNTILAGSPAAITGVVLGRFFTPEKKYDLMLTLGAGLAGMVAICAGCNAMDPWAAIVVGIGAAIVMFFCSKLMVRMRIDDPVDAVAVHLGAGLWGLLITPILDREDGVLMYWDEKAFTGLLYNIVGAAFIIGWCVVTVLPVFLILKKRSLLRVSPEMEQGGLDYPKHGTEAYPETNHCTVCHPYGSMKSYSDYEGLIRRRMKDGKSATSTTGGVWSTNGVAPSLPNVPPPAPREVTPSSKINPS